jgi:2-amino-4-hydroxy-6-hydroxymethyldihydropteridine diphosphokinase
MENVFLLLGSNLGDRYSILSQAVNYIEGRIGVIQQKSSIYESDPWGFEHKNAFLNQVLVVKTDKTPESVLKLAQDIEVEFGRIRRSTNEYEGRTIDIDILFYNEQVINKRDLTVPHPLLQDRRFTLQPLVEIASDMIHPVFKKNMKQLLDECPDDQEAKRVS